MKILRRITVILFVLSLCAFVLTVFYDKKTTDVTYPVIEMTSKQMEISIYSTEDELLKDVKAYDEKDGDLTDKLIIESLSQFVGEGVYTVTYAVSDSDCHVTKATRTVCYTDYIPPRFYLVRPLVFSVGEKVDFRTIVGAADCIDGNISDKVSFVATDYTSTTAGVYTLSVQATSNRGDVIYRDFPVYVEQNTQLAPKINLSRAILYLNIGEEADFASYVESVTSGGALMESYELDLSTDFDSNTPGMYSVHYYVTNDGGHVGHTILTVIVED